MKTATQVIFASALMLSVVAPSLSHARVHARVVAPSLSHARDVMQVPRDIFEFYGTGNTSVPGIGVDKDDSRYQKSR
jgi:hypothetical protein